MERSLSETPTLPSDNPLITVHCAAKERKEFTQEKTLNCFKSQLEDKQAKCIMISDYLLHYCMGPLVDHLKTNFHSITGRSHL